MTGYCVHLLDGDRRIARPVKLFSESDRKAVVEAYRLKHGGGAEVWRGSELVGRIWPVRLNGEQKPATTE